MKRARSAGPWASRRAAPGRRPGTEAGRRAAPARRPSPRRGSLYASGLLVVASLLLLAAATPVAAQQSHLLVIAGLGGEARYGDAFHRWAVEMIDAATSRHGVAPDHVVYLAEKVDRDPARIDGRATRENVEAAFAEVAGRAGPDDRVFVLLIGHGSFREGEASVNLPGPDMSAADFTPLLARFPSQEIVFVNAASASGPFVEALSGPRRTVITATRTGLERNETVFGGYFVEAFAGGGADIDKDGAVSVLEAFTYARREVARVYEEDNRLLTEHALLDDDGDGEGSDEPGAQGGDGARARGLFLGSGSATRAAGADSQDPELQRLYRARSGLEERIDRLREQKDAMDPERYETELETLLVELATTNRAIREREGRKP